MLRDIAIAAALLVAGFVLGIGYSSWKGEPTRQEKTDALAGRIADSNPGLDIESTYVSTSGPMIYLSMPPLEGERAYHPVAKIEIGHDGEILPSFFDFDEDYYDYHWNKSMSEDEVMAKIDEIEAEYEKRR